MSFPKHLFWSTNLDQVNRIGMGTSAASKAILLLTLKMCFGTLIKCTKDVGEEVLFYMRNMQKESHSHLLSWHYFYKTSAYSWELYDNSAFHWSSRRSLQPALDRITNYPMKGMKGVCCRSKFRFDAEHVVALKYSSRKISYICWVLDEQLTSH